MSRLESLVESGFRHGMRSIIHGGAALAVVSGPDAAALIEPSASADVPHFGVDSPFHLCSLAKPVLASVATLLEATGLLSWTMPVQDLVPEFLLPGRTGTCTLHQLAAMQTGLSRIGIAEWGIDQLRPKAERVGRARHMTTIAAPGTDFSYSNLGYVALGLAMERLTGETLDRLARTYIFDPMSMRTAWFAGFGTSDRPIVQRPSIPVDGRAKSVGDLTGPNSEGSARLCMSATDGVRWIEGLLRALRRSSESPLVSMSSQWTPIRNPDPRISPEGSPDSYYGRGLIVTRHGDTRLLHHGGGGRGWRHHLLLAPDRAAGVLLMASAECPRVTGLAFDLLDLLLDRPPRRWIDVLEHEARAVAARDSARVDRAREDVRAPECGIYWNALTGRVTVRRSRLGLEFVPADAPALSGILQQVHEHHCRLVFDDPAMARQPLDPEYRVTMHGAGVKSMLRADYFGDLARRD